MKCLGSSIIVRTLLGCIPCTLGLAITDALASTPVHAEQLSEATSVVVFGASPARSAMIVDYAEQVRRSAFERLLSDPQPRPWVPRCAIHVHGTPAAFAAAVGGSPEAARGASSLEFGADRVISRRIDVLGDGPDVIPDALAHELVHVVLADRFTEAAPPRWADEGIALLFDGVDKQASHEADFRAAERRGLAFSVADLLALEEYPSDARLQRIFYGQSAALVRWLIERRDAATFIRFVVDLQSDDPESALERHYELDMAAVIDSAWKEVLPIHSLSFNSAEQ